MALRLLAALLAAWCVLAVRCQLQLGDPCLTKDGRTGICRDPAKSPCLEFEQIRQGGNPQMCSFVGLKPIVCCSTSLHLSEQSRRSKSYQKCVEYARILEDEIESVPILTPTTSTSDFSDCPIIPDGTQLIVGGNVTRPNEFPHMAALGFGQPPNIQWKCGGSLISKQFLLTAAHCMFDRETGTVNWVRLGDLNIHSSLDDADAQMIAVKNRIPHPSYSGKAHYNDIALIELLQEVEYSAAVRPACIHHQEGDTSESLTASVTGWGKTDNNNQGISSVLMKAPLKFVSHRRCSPSYRAGPKLRSGLNETTMVCAGDPKGEKDTCQGDSGGPIQLVLEDPTCMYVIVGVTSFGPLLCANGNVPGVYTRLKPFLPWIESVVWRD